MQKQMSLLDDVLSCYENTEMDNTTLYSKVSRKQRVNLKEHIRPSGKQSAVNVYKRKVRWAQQTLKQQGLIERLEKGQWRITQTGKQKLTQTVADNYLIAGSTRLGILVWCNSLVALEKALPQTVHLCFTSPPYLGIERSYGTYWDEDAFIDFVLRLIEPICKRLAPGGNIALNMTNDSVLRKQAGARSYYLEKLTLRLHEQLGLHLMDRLVWEAKDKSAKGYQVTHARTHLVSRYEPILWFCNSPQDCLADNRRVLTPYGKSMLTLLKQGGVKGRRANTDYQSVSREGGFSVDHGGAIPGNVLSFSTVCKSNRQVLKDARSLSLPTHGALFPRALADFIVRWLCPEDGVVVDPCAGYGATGEASELADRAYVLSEWHFEYLMPAVRRMSQFNEYWVNPLFEKLLNTELRASLCAD